MKGGGEAKKRTPPKKTINPSKTHILIVAPADPVPDSLKIALDPSVNRNRTPWFLETDPSTG